MKNRILEQCKILRVDNILNVVHYWSYSDILEMSDTYKTAIIVAKSQDKIDILNEKLDQLNEALFIKLNNEEEGC